MAKLTTKARGLLAASQFAGPGKTFPVEDKKHAKAAIMDAPAAVRKGTLSKGSEKRIDAKAEAKLGGNKAVRQPSKPAPMPKRNAPTAPKRPNPFAPKPDVNMGKPNTTGRVKAGDSMSEDKGHQLAGKPGHFSYK